MDTTQIVLGNVQRYSRQVIAMVKRVKIGWGQWAVIFALLLSAFAVVIVDGQSLQQRPVLPASQHSQQPATNNQPQTERNEQKVDWKNWTRDPITVFTFALVIVGIVASIFGIALWLATRKSARISERALTELEAPFLSIKINRAGLDIKGNNVTFGTLRWCLANYGRSPASILEVWDETKSTKLGVGLPPKIDPAVTAGTPMPYGLIARPNGESEEFPFLAISELLPGAGPDIPFSEKVLFFMGYVRYADIFRRRFILGFCFVFDRTGNRWILAGGGDYNYCRRDYAPRAPDWYQPTADNHSVRSAIYRAIRKHED